MKEFVPNIVQTSYSEGLDGDGYHCTPSKVCRQQNKCFGPHEECVWYESCNKYACGCSSGFHIKTYMVDESVEVTFFRRKRSIAFPGFDLQMMPTECDFDAMKRLHGRTSVHYLKLFTCIFDHV